MSCSWNQPSGKTKKTTNNCVINAVFCKLLSHKLQDKQEETGKMC